MPLDWCQGPGVRLDFRGREKRDISADDLRAELDRVEYELVPGSIPVLWTGADALIDDDKRYWEEQAGISIEGLHFLLDRGVHLIGIDAYAMDVSHASMQTAMNEGTPRLFPAHFVGREREHMHLEKLTELGKLPRAHGCHFIAMPIKLRGGSAGWVRPVAFVPKSHFSRA